MAGLLSVSSARLRCARTLWTIAERPPGSEAEVERGALEAGALRAGVDSGRRCMAALVNSRAAVCLLGQRRRKKNSGNGCCTKNCDGPWTGVGGRGRVWEGRWGLYKGPQRPPASRISSPTVSHISAFSRSTRAFAHSKEEGGSRATVSRQYIPSAHRVFGSNWNGPISSLMLRTASVLAVTLFLAGMLNA